MEAMLTTIIVGVGTVAMVQLLDVPSVHEVVDELVSAARAAAEGEAERLRQQLAEVETDLKAALVKANVIHQDETGVRVGKEG